MFMDRCVMDWMSVAEAAAKLGLSEPHVRRLAATGALPAHRLSCGWVVSAAAVRDRAHFPPAAGRPLSPAMAWALLHLVDAAGPENPQDATDAPGADRLALGWAAAGDRKVRYRLRGLLGSAPAPHRWSQWLRRRAEPRRLWVHSGVLDRFTKDQRLRPAGGFAAAASGFGIVAGPPRRFYIDAADVDAVIAHYRGGEQADGQVELMVIPDTVAVAMRPQLGVPVPAAVALVDLLDSADARERHLAIEFVAEISRRFQQPVASR
jgi:excisionase family DNA binding protein